MTENPYHKACLHLREIKLFHCSAFMTNIPGFRSETWIKFWEKWIESPRVFLKMQKKTPQFYKQAKKPLVL